MILKLTEKNSKSPSRLSVYWSIQPQETGDAVCTRSACQKVFTLSREFMYLYFNYYLLFKLMSVNLCIYSNFLFLHSYTPYHVIAGLADGTLAIFSHSSSKYLDLLGSYLSMSLLVWV